jgi:hypothetical protein
VAARGSGRSALEAAGGGCSHGAGDKHVHSAEMSSLPWAVELEARPGGLGNFSKKLSVEARPTQAAGWSEGVKPCAKGISVYHVIMGADDWARATDMGGYSLLERPARTIRRR